MDYRKCPEYIRKSKEDREVFLQKGCRFPYVSKSFNFPWDDNSSLPPLNFSEFESGKKEGVFYCPFMHPCKEH